MPSNKNSHFYVGCYTDSPSQSCGIGQVVLNGQTGELTRVEDLYSLRNPSYLLETEQGIVTVSEVVRDQGAQVVHITNEATVTKPLNGDYPCHLAVSPDKRYLAIANYASGNVNVFQLNDAGEPQQAIGDLYVDGCGPNADRQEAPHAHQVTFLAHTPHLAVVDLGADAIHFYHHDQAAQFSHEQSVALTAGSGPRHMVFNQRESVAYVVCELSETLVVLRKHADGKWCVTSEQKLITEQETGEAAAAIKLSADERYVYVSCRAQNTLCVFDVSADTPKLIGRYPTGGDFPRDFTLSQDGKWLLVANQHSNNIVSFKLDHQTGQLEASGFTCQIDAPVCVVEKTAFNAN
ncbi:6-phosphogluconolactonase [Vibrio galatheae]|uniref:6-phosphogluconolactonase n=1 Tax=Vibrio galatheae TaxID=579748 RepID=A0A0F4NIA8_9VIBR|nr:lactonase family protein [Vibrio galatheae]KJY81796.1 6-phosphogluconolactonase [Vibrio galatheae]